MTSLHNFDGRLRFLNAPVLRLAVTVLIALSSSAQQAGSSGLLSRSFAASTPIHDSILAQTWKGGPSSVNEALSNPDTRQNKDTFSATASESVNFEKAVRYDAGAPCVNSVVVADLNGDGKLDLVTANGCTNINGQGPLGSVSVMLGNGDGTFQRSVTYYSGGLDAVSVQVGDVNGDGNPDLLVANTCSSQACPGGIIVVLLGQGDGSFQPAATYDYLQPLSLALADVNGDGRLDLVVIGNPNHSNGESGLVSILLGNGDGTFREPVTYRSGYSNSSVAVADVNGDGKLDIIVAEPCSDGFCADGFVDVLLGNGDGTFQPSVAYSSGGPDGLSVAVADVNRDGKADVLVAKSCFSGTDCLTGAVAVLLGNGDGTFAPPVIYGSGAAEALSLAIGDVNGDGRPDAVVANCTHGTSTGFGCPFGDGVIGVLLGNGDGTFQRAATYDSGGVLARSVAIADVNADGRPDLVAANASGGPNGDGTVGVLLNNSGQQSLTTTTLSSSLNPSLVGQAVTFTATVHSAAGVPPNGEIITFKNGSAVLGTGPLNGGTASLTTSSLPTGILTITASYGGDANFAASTSAGLQQVVNSTTKSATSTVLVPSLNPSIYGQKVTWTATVTTSGSVPPTGTVKFTWDGYSIGTATLNAGGVAMLSKSNLNVYTYPLTAVYSGDANNLGSTSAILNQVVKEATSAATLTASLNPSVSGQAVTFTATITSPTVTPTGPVTFTAGTKVLGTAQLGAHKATFTTSALPAGSTTVKATYAGNSNIAGSSASVTQTVQ